MNDLWYQNAVINGVAMPAERKQDTSERRWRELIEPLVPPDGDGRLFVELGCNAGFYLRRASDLGYRAIGVERNPLYVTQAKFWEAEDPRGIQIIQGDLNEYDLPACYLCLLANVHYWQTPEQLTALVDKLRARVLYVLIVGRQGGSPDHLSSALDADFMKGSWWINKGCSGSKHWSELYHNPNLTEMDVKALFAAQPFTRSRRFLPAFREFIDLTLSGQRFRLDRTAMHEYMLWRGFRHKVRFLRRWWRLIRSVQREGILRPLILDATGKVVDGDHRLIIAERLGIKKVICQTRSST